MSGGHPYLGPFTFNVQSAFLDACLPNGSFAAEARAPRTAPAGLSRAQFAQHSRDVIMSVFGIGHTINTIVGNEFIRGVSGGE